MTITPSGNSPYGSDIVLTITLNGITNGAAAVSSAFACPSDAAGAYYDMADIRINLGAATALGTTAPVYLQAACIAQLDGTNFGAAGAVNGQIYSGGQIAVAPYPTSLTEQYLDIYNLLLLPGATNIAIVVLNNLGITLPTTGVTATLYPRMGALG